MAKLFKWLYVSFDAMSVDSYWNKFVSASNIWASLTLLFGIMHSFLNRKMMTRKRHLSIIPYQYHKITISQLKKWHIILILYKNTIQKKDIIFLNGYMKMKKFTDMCTRTVLGLVKYTFFTIYTSILWAKFETFEDKSLITCILVLIIV